MKNQSSETAAICLGAFLSLAGIAIFGLCAYGYVMNIVKLASLMDVASTGMTVLRAVGVFIAPLGIILGFC